MQKEPVCEGQEVSTEKKTKKR